MTRRNIFDEEKRPHFVNEAKTIFNIKMVCQLFQENEETETEKQKQIILY